MDSQRFKAFPIPSTELLSRDPIRFLHPGYPIPNTLLSLPRVDHTSGTFGVHHRTALLACQIIANNAFDAGYLTLDQTGQQRVDIPLDGILTEEAYYFIVSGGPNRYAVVPSFRDWEFPHGHIPDFWPRGASTDSHHCSVTKFSRFVEMAHLVPKEEADWYSGNDMMRYNTTTGVSAIDDPANLLPLRVDIHRLFDARGFVIVPKKIEIDGPFQYVTHILASREAEFWPAHHNVLVQTVQGGSHPYLFARFAWAILLHVKKFVIAQPRHVATLEISLDEQGLEKREYKTKLLTAEQLMQRYGGGGSGAATKASTPKKRPSSMLDNEFTESSGNDEDEDGTIHDVWDLMDYGERGSKRRKKQKSSEETAPYLPSDVEADFKEIFLQGMAAQEASKDPNKTGIA